MLSLILIRLIAPRIFRLFGWLVVTFFFVTVLAIAIGMIDHGRNQQTQHYERVEWTR